MIRPIVEVVLYNLPFFICETTFFIAYKLDCHGTKLFFCNFNEIFCYCIKKVIDT